MKKRWIYLSAALMLLVGACVRMPMIGGAAPADPVDVEKECSVTVSPVDASDPEKADYLADMEKTHITLELYKIAGAEKVTGYDTYQFVPESAYGGLAISDYSRLQELTVADWKALAQDAARIALAQDSSQSPAASREIEGVADAVLSGQDVKAGLYLLVARDTNLTKEEYVKTVQAETADGETVTEPEKLVTIANSNQYEYMFEPQLVALPTKQPDASGVISTANPGPWLYEEHVYLKSGREPRYAPLEIVKTLRSWETVEGTIEPVTFVFRVVATLEGEEVFNEVTSLTFTEPGTGRTTLERIPATATVTVTEIYNGLSYTQSVPSDNGPVVLDSISAETENTASFENVYNNTRTHCHGIWNKFVYNAETGGWEWSRDPQPAGRQEGE